MGSTAFAAPSVDTGGIPGGGGIDLGAELGGAFDSALTGGESTPSSSEPARLAQSDTELFSSDQPEAQPAQPAADPADQPQPGAEPASPYTLSPDGKFYQVPKSELPNFQTAQKYHQAVSQLFATPQEAQQAQFQARNHRLFMNDLQSGDPNSIQTALNHLAGFDHEGDPSQKQFQQGFSQMAELLPATLQKVNPQAYDAMATKFVATRVDAAYQRAWTEQQPNQYDEKGNPTPGSPLYLAQVMDYDLTGTYKTNVSQITQKAQPQQLSEQDRRIQESESRYATALKRDSDDFHVNGVENPKFSQLNGTLDKVLEKIKDRYEPVAYNDIKDNIRRELIDTINGTRAGLTPAEQADNAAWAFEHKQEHAALIRDFQNIWKNGGNPASLRPRVQSYQQSFASRAARLLPAIAQKRIGAATQAARARTQSGQFAAPQPQTSQPAQPAATQQSRVTSRDQLDRNLAADFAPFRQ